MQKAIKISAQSSLSVEELWDYLEKGWLFRCLGGTNIELKLKNGGAFGLIGSLEGL